MSMTSRPPLIREAQRFLEQAHLAGWLVHDYRSSNPVFWELVAPLGMVTRPCFLWIPAGGAEPTLLAHHVDAGKFADSGVVVAVYRSRAELLERLQTLLPTGRPVAMEYSPMAALPRTSRVDAGTLELVRSLGVEVVPSADLLQYATQRWSEEQLQSHRRAAQKLGRIVHEAFAYIRRNYRQFVTEHMVAQYIRRLFQEHHLTTAEGPIVAVNRHAADPHYEPTSAVSAPIRRGDWVLIDLWAKEEEPADAVYADITWVARVGDRVPTRDQEAYDAVVAARDAALEFLRQAHRQGRTVQGWEVDQVARATMAERGYGEYFTHRLGHSLGRDVHGEAVNLDDFETHDTRAIIPGIGFTIEPGVYLADFGVRSEIDVFMGEGGPEVTSPVQTSVLLIL